MAKPIPVSILLEEDEVDRTTKRRKIEHRGSISRNSYSDTPDAHKTTYRVTMIPQIYDQDSFRLRVAEALGLDEDADFQVHSFATDQDSRFRVATISFGSRPSFLDPPEEEWELKLPGESDEDGQPYTLVIDVNFIGFTPISPARNDSDHVIDCFVLHGWGGHALGSFKATGSSYVWLRTLAKDVPQLRIWLFGYKSSLTDPKSLIDYFEYAQKFRILLRSLRRQTKANDKTTPIIYMAHSLGGLIFKEASEHTVEIRQCQLLTILKALISMKENNDADDLIHITSTYGALLFGVPARGMNVKALAAMIGEKPVRYNLSLLDREVGFRLRENRHKDFCNAFNYTDSKIIQFFETDLSPTVEEDAETKKWSRTGPAELLVGPASATCGRSWETGDDYKISLHGDHSTMVKFQKNDRDGYHTVRHFLQDFVKRAMPTIESRLQAIGRGPKREMHEAEKDCVQSLHFPEWDARFRDIKSPETSDTCNWILSHHQFEGWRKAPEPQVMLLTGKPGCGKSVLAKFIYMNLKSDLETNNKCNNVVAFFSFNDRGIETEKITTGMMRALLTQIFRQEPVLLEDLSMVKLHDNLKDNQKSRDVDWPAEILYNVFLQLRSAREGFVYHLIVDSLDEASKDSRVAIIDLFKNLIDKRNCKSTFRVFLTTRPEALNPPLQPFNCLRIQLERMDGKHVDNAIQCYVSSQVEKFFPSSHWGDTRKLVIRLTSRSNGIFLWVNLVIRDLRDQAEAALTIQEVEEKVEDVPQGMTALYSNMLARKTSVKPEQRKILLQWILLADRPLTVEELKIAFTMNLEPGKYKSEKEVDDKINLDRFKQLIQIISHGLVELRQSKRKSDKTMVQLIHQSAKDFLLDKVDEWRPDAMTRPLATAHIDLTKVCIQYLLLADLPESFFDTGQFSFSQCRSRIYQHHLLLFASTNWCRHANAALAVNERCSEDIVLLLKKRSRMLNSFQIQSWEQIPALLFEIPPLLIASRDGFQELVRFFIKMGEDVNATLVKVAAGIASRTALQAAAEKGLEIIEQLEAQADLNPAPAKQYDLTAIQAAAGKGHLEVFKQLLTAWADVKASGSWWISRTALQAAAQKGYCEIVEQLLEARADVNAAPAAGGGRTALQAAAEGGHPEIVERLLLAQADVNAAPAKLYGRTALQAAASRGHLEVVKRLLAAQANVDAVTYGRTALEMAIEHGHYEIAEALREASARDLETDNVAVTTTSLSDLEHDE